MKLPLCYVLIIALIASFVSATINPAKNKKTKQKTQAEAKINVGPQEKSVYERNLVENEPLASEILAESGTYYRETSLKNFNGTVLGYVTPVSYRFFSSDIELLILALISVEFKRL